MKRPKGAPLTKAEMRAQAEQAIAAATKPITKLPTKLVRQCGQCGEPTTVMVEPGEVAPAFVCKHCGKSDKARTSPPSD